MRIFEESQPNCIGFVLFKLGIIPEEKFVGLDPLEELNLMETDFENAQAFGILTGRRRILVHAAVVHQDDPSLVEHRPGTGHQPRIDSFEDVFSPFKDSPFFEKVALKRKQQP